jgi:NAD(P)H-hydrate epimerase
MNAKTDHYFSRAKDVRKLKRPRAKYDHKGKYGKALLISGSYGKMGAAVLAARAAVRSGLGLLTVHVPKTGYEIIQTSVPESMASVDESNEFFSSVPSNIGQYDTLGIGPGIGVEDLTAEALEKVLSKFNKPVVLDADALNILSANREMLHLVPRGSILTPHPKEFERLTTAVADDFERLQIVKELSAETHSVVILKGAHTAVVTPQGSVYFNSSGNPGLAKGGSGDVLTGLVTGLLAQGYTSEQAAVLGVFWHGKAADNGARKYGMDALTASDVIECLATVSWGN